MKKYIIEEYTKYSSVDIKRIKERKLRNLRLKKIKERLNNLSIDNK